MRKSRWFMLLLVYCLYLILGGFIIRAIESHHYLKRARHKWENIKHLQAILLHKINSTNPDWDTRTMKKLSDVCHVDFIKVTDFNQESEDIWSFYNSFFFCFTVVTTIGYGNLSPSTIPGKVFCILFALIGIPLNGILIATLGGYFTDMIVKRHQRMKSKSEHNRMSAWIDTLFYLIPGMAVFFLLPAWCFILLEGWYFYDSIYYSVVTLTTVGFGDLVAGMEGTGGNSYGMWVYKIAVIVWILFGMGYFIMILTFITKAFNKTPVKKITAKMTKGIVKTKKKIKKGLFRFGDYGDINKLIKAVHMFDMQVVPKHRNRLKRSKSCADVQYLEVFAQKAFPLRQVSSTSAIYKVDKEATFKKDWKDYEDQCQLLLQLAAVMMSDVSVDEVTEETVEETDLEESREDTGSVDLILPPDPNVDTTDSLGKLVHNGKHLFVANNHTERKASLVDRVIDTLTNIDRKKPSIVQINTLEPLCSTINETTGTHEPIYRRSLSVPRASNNISAIRRDYRSRSLKIDKFNKV